MGTDASGQQSAVGTLLLDDGTRFNGVYSGPAECVAGEVVFNTAMEGYVETFTDPSFGGQILTCTYPLIGNYGVPDADGSKPGSSHQSSRVQIQGLIVQTLSAAHSHHAAQRSLQQWLTEHRVPLLTGVDTRALTQKLRGAGTMYGWIVPPHMSEDEAKRTARAVEMQSEVFKIVTSPGRITYDAGPNRVLLIDVGVKNGIIDCLLRRGLTVDRVPWWHDDLRTAARAADGIIIGNGPGDPAQLGALSANVRQLLDERNVPIFGICMGHQIVSQALGLKTYKLPFGHRGVNQPVQDVTTGKCYVTSQNHGFAVDDRTLPPDCTKWFVNLNDGTNEGLRLTHRAVRSVQFHPEGNPGPRDSAYLFDEFAADVGARKVAGQPAGKTGAVR